MLHSLKETISKTVHNIVEKLSPSLNRQNNKEDDQSSRKSLKRDRVSHVSLNEALRPDMLVTPPEKRLKKVHEETGREVSSFKDFIAASKNATNQFFWRYVVEGEANSNLDKKRGLAGGMDGFKKDSDKTKVDTELLTSSTFSFKKAEEPKLKFYQNPVDAVTKRKPLHSHVSHNVQSASSKPRVPSVETDRQSSKITSVPHGTRETSVKRCVLEVCGNENPTLPSWKPVRRVTTADTVIRLEERDRYRKLLAQFTSTPSYLEGTVLNSSIFATDDVRSSRSLHPNNDPNGTYIERLQNQDVLSSTNYRNFPRHQHADSILKKFSSTLAEVASFNPSLSSTAVSSDVRLFKEAASSVDHRSNARATSELNTKERERLFSGADTSNIARNERAIGMQDKDPLGDMWTLKWRKILQDGELDRQKQIKKEELKLKGYENKRKEREAELLKKIEARKDLDRKKAEPKHTPLTDEMRRLISNAWRPGNPQECLVEAFNVAITRHDLATLADLNWLNDEVVNFYFHLLQERSKEQGYLKMHFFNSFFYPKLLKTGYSGVRRWTKKVDIFSVDIVVLPVHLGMHWCLAAIDMRKKQIAYYDSLKGNNIQCVTVLRNYIAEEHKDKKKTALNMDEWSQISPKNIPEQQNGCDCGVFTCKYAECLTRDSTFNFTQTDMPYFRERMVYEILKKKLLR